MQRFFQIATTRVHQERCNGGQDGGIAMLYADVRGSTQLAAGMRPAEFGALMQRFFQIATTRVHQERCNGGQDGGR